jgi:hypothetical protein
MTVTASPQDAAGAQIDQSIAALQAIVTADNASAAAVDFSVQQQLLQLQTDAVDHYMAVGRISPATILSTLS